MYINLSAGCLKIKVSERYKATATRLSLYCLCGIMRMQSMLKFRISIALLATLSSICVAGCICSCISALVSVSKFVSVPCCYCICISLVLFLAIYLCICICISMCISVLYLYLYLSCFPVCLALPFGSVTYRFDFVYLSTLKKSQTHENRMTNIMTLGIDSAHTLYEYICVLSHNSIHSQLW